MLRAFRRHRQALQYCFSHGSRSLLHNEAEAARDQAAAMLREQGGASSNIQIFDRYVQRHMLISAAQNAC